MSKATISYKNSGVDIGANALWVRAIRKAMKSTHDPRVVSRDGAFAGMYRLGEGTKGKAEFRSPVLVGCADGVGTKVLLGIKAGKLRGLGIDLVAMNVNDLITCGATPLFFLDYIAVHKLDADHLLAIVEGIADGCRQAGCALLGGETAEMPDLYRRGDFDLAGFSLGVVEHKRSIDGSRVSPGDILIGLPSSGIHANGFSLVRKVISRRRLRLNRVFDELGGTLADAVLAPTTIYVQPVLAAVNAYRTKAAVTGMAHITGGGLAENVARALGPKCDAVIETRQWEPHPIFPFLQNHGVQRDEMFRVFNMGIGYVLVVRPTLVKGVIRVLEERNVSPLVIGRVKRGHGRVVLR